MKSAKLTDVFCFSDMRTSRTKLLELLVDPNHSVETMERTANDYFALLQGLYQQIDPNEAENKLRKVISFKWSNSLTGSSAMCVLLIMETVRLHLFVLLHGSVCECMKWRVERET